MLVLTDKEARDEREKIILEHLPQIRYIARRIMDRLPLGAEFEDLVSAGILGLLDALEKFDASRGVKFKTYAEIRIKGKILDSLRDLDWSPRSLRIKSKKLEKVYRLLNQRFGRSATDEEVCQEMGITLEKFYKLLDDIKGLTLGDFLPLQIPGPDGDGSDDLLEVYVPDEEHPDPLLLCHQSEVKSILMGAIDTLPEKERTVIGLYYCDGLTMKEIGKVLGVNESRVSQLHTRAILRLRVRLCSVLGKDPKKSVRMIPVHNQKFKDLPPAALQIVKVAPREEPRLSAKSRGLRLAQSRRQINPSDLHELVLRLEEKLKQKLEERELIAKALKICQPYCEKNTV